MRIRYCYNYSIQAPSPSSRLHCHASCHTTSGAVNAGTCDARCFFFWLRTKYSRCSIISLHLSSLAFFSYPLFILSFSSSQGSSKPSPLVLAYSLAPSHTALSVPLSRTSTKYLLALSRPQVTPTLAPCPELPNLAGPCDAMQCDSIRHSAASGLGKRRLLLCCYAKSRARQLSSSKPSGIAPAQIYLLTGMKHSVSRNTASTLRRSGITATLP